jgi:hypothetical protein
MIASETAEFRSYRSIRSSWSTTENSRRFAEPVRQRVGSRKTKSLRRSHTLCAVVHAQRVWYIVIIDSKKTYPWTFIADIGHSGRLIHGLA